MFTIAGLLLSACLFSQQAISSLGGDINNGSESISVTLGQISINNGQIGNFDQNEGVQQPYEFLMMTHVNDFGSFDVELKVFPNPADNELTVNFSDLENTIASSYVIWNAQGQLIKKGPLKDSNSTISLINIPTGLFYISIVNNTNQISYPIKFTKI